MKHTLLLLLPLILLLFISCNDNSVEEYDDTEDLAFLEQYRLETGVNETNSGLLYKVIEEGEEGERPNSDNHVIVQYNGKSFDAQFGMDTSESPLGFDIYIPDQMTNFSGMGEGVLLMNKGARYEFVLPTELATGDGRVFIIELELESFIGENQEQFLESNAQLEDIEVTNSGLQYRIIEESDGGKPTNANRVDIRYTGKYTSGYVFDRSPGNQTVELIVSGTIPGFSEGLQLMNEGSKFEFFISPELGYGNELPQLGAVLVFEVELVEILN